MTIADHIDEVRINLPQSSAILIIVAFVSAFLSYALNVTLAWLLSLEEYGLYGVCIAFINVLSFFISFGFPWTVTRLLAGEDNIKKRYAIMKSSILGNFITAAAVSVIFYFIYLHLIGSEKFPTILVYIIASTILLSSILTVQTRALQGLFRFKEMAVVQSLPQFLRFALTVGLVYLGYGVLGVLAGFAVTIVAGISTAAYILRDFKFWHGRGWLDLGVYRFSVPTFLVMAALTTLSQSSILGVKFLASGVISNELAGYYQAIQVLAVIPVFITVAMIDAVFPFIAKYTQAGSQSYSDTAIKYVFLFTFPLAMAVTLTPQAFITFFFPNEYILGANALAIMAIGMGAFAITYVLATTFQGIGKLKLPAITMLIAVGIQILGLLFLVPRLGLVGAATSTTMASIFAVTFLLMRYVKLYKLRLKLSRIVSLAVVFVVSGAFLFFFPHSGRILLVIDLLLASTVYMFLLLILGFINEKDVRILGSALPQLKCVKLFIGKAVKFTTALNDITKMGT